MSLELPAALAAVEAFLGRPFPDGDEDALVRPGDDHDGRPGDDHDGRPGADARVAGLGLKASAGLLLARKGVTLLQYGLIAAALAETLASGGEPLTAGGEPLGPGGAPAPALRQAGQRALDAVTADDLPA
ncbi:hypothetical protein [Nonomuraea rubra]|uniref:hypothetical protein n=1 Tax=Nonomuraea rubra TaxID=46180 RepID=UPI00360B9C46